MSSRKGSTLGAEPSSSHAGTGLASETMPKASEQIPFPKGGREANASMGEPNSQLSVGQVDNDSPAPTGNAGMSQSLSGLTTGAGLVVKVKYAGGDAGRDRSGCTPANPERAGSLCGPDQVVGSTDVAGCC